MVDRTKALSETKWSELCGHSLGETTEPSFIITWVFFFHKYCKFWSIWPEHFVECKSLIFEECHDNHLIKAYNYQVSWCSLHKMTTFVAKKWQKKLQKIVPQNLLSLDILWGKPNWLSIGRKFGQSSAEQRVRSTTTMAYNLCLS